MKIRIFLTAALAAIALLLTACGDPEIVVVVATPQPPPTSTPESSPTPTAQPISTPSVTDLIEYAQAYVVRIDHENGCASGVLLGNSGLVLTNDHVIRGANSLAATTVDGTRSALEVLTYDKERDLALLQATWPLPALATIPLNTDTDLRLGESIFVLGYPFPGSQSPNDCSESITVTHRRLSGRINIRGQEWLQTDAALNPGVSGGLALTSTGVIAGMAVSGLTPDVAESVGFLIPVSAIVERLTEWLVKLETGHLEPPAPTGQIAFTNDRFGDSNVYVMDADGGNVRRLTDYPGANASPTWSPDGTRITFTSDRDGNYDIYVMDADGGNVRRLTDDPGGDYEATWSPDGTRIAFASNRDVGVNYDIYVMDADGGNVRRLTNDPGRDMDPAWSPDGTRIAFASNRDGDRDIYVMDADGGNVRRLTDEGGGSPTWSPDGTWIAFESYRDDTFDIYVMDADGGDIRQLRGTRGHRDNPGGDYDPAWSPGP